MKRLGNFSVVIISVAVFLVAFVILLLWGSAQRPPTITVLVAARDLSIGDVVDASSVTQKVIVKDENADLYLLAEEAEKVYGAVVSLPFRKGQPIYRSAVMAVTDGQNRLSVLLSAYPDGVLFTIPLDLPNVYAPEAETFVPGDLVGVTVVIASRPQEKPTPMPENMLYGAYMPGVVPTLGPIMEPTPTPEKSEREKALDRVYPPLSKDLFPNGVRVIAVQGVVPATTGAEGSSDSAQQASVISYQAPQPKLIVLVPHDQVEPLALALQQGYVYVTLLAKGQPETGGFSYWDLEEMIKKDRERLLPTPTPTPGAGS